MTLYRRGLCKSCGELSEVDPFMICEDCKKDYEKVRSYIEKNNRVNALDIASATNVSINKITNMIKNGAFAFEM